MWFTIDRYDHGCTGNRYPSKLKAIKGGSWSPWNDAKVKKAFNFGNGTMDDFNRYCKDNNCDVVMEDDFWVIARPLGDEWRKNAEEFINRTMKVWQSTFTM